MAGLKTFDPDVHELKLVFALMLSDQFTETNQLEGRITVRIANQPFVPVRSLDAESKKIAPTVQEVQISFNSRQEIR